MTDLLKGQNYNNIYFFILADGGLNEKKIHVMYHVKQWEDVVSVNMWGSQIGLFSPIFIYGIEPERKGCRKGWSYLMWRDLIKSYDKESDFRRIFYELVNS